jgi:hypothetical protein
MQTCDGKFSPHTDRKQGLGLSPESLLSNKGNRGQSHQRLNVADREEGGSDLRQGAPARERNPLADYQRTRGRVAALEDPNQTSSPPIGEQGWMVRARSILWVALSSPITFPGRRSTAAPKPARPSLPARLGPRSVTITPVSFTSGEGPVMSGFVKHAATPLPCVEKAKGLTFSPKTLSSRLGASG